MISSLTFVRLAFATLFACVTLGCNHSAVKSSPPEMIAEKIIPWNRSQLSGLEVTLIDDHRVEYFGFNSNGMVVVTYGTIQKKWFLSQLSVCSPLDYWSLEKGVLVIRGHEGNLYERLYLLSLTKELLIVVRQDGTKAKYKVHAITTKA